MREDSKVSESTRLTVRTHGACEHIHTHIPSVRFCFRVLRVILLLCFFFLSIKKQIYAFLLVKSLQHFTKTVVSPDLWTSAHIPCPLAQGDLAFEHTEYCFSPLPRSSLLFHPLHSTLNVPLTHSTSSFSFTRTPPSR